MTSMMFLSLALSIVVLVLLLVAALLIVQTPGAIAGLLVVQIVYKLTTPLTVGSFTNPVVVSNLLIAPFHGATLRSSRASLFGAR